MDPAIIAGHTSDYNLSKREKGKRLYRVGRCSRTLSLSREHRRYVILSRTWGLIVSCCKAENVFPALSPMFNYASECALSKKKLGRPKSRKVVRSAFLDCLGEDSPIKPSEMAAAVQADSRLASVLRLLLSSF